MKINLFASKERLVVKRPKTICQIVPAADVSMNTTEILEDAEKNYTENIL